MFHLHFRWTSAFSGPYPVWHMSSQSSDAVKQCKHREGPATFEEFSTWPKSIVEKLFARGDGNDYARLNRLKSLCAGGLQVYSDYSGLAGEYEFLFQLGEALNLHADTKMNFTVTHRRFCDSSKVAQSILKKISETQVDHEPCVMCDINSRLPKHALAWLDASMPSPEDSAESSAGSYRSMERYLMENRDAIFQHATTDWCVVHNRRCSLFPERSQSTDDQLQPLVMNFAGTTCRGWSSAGKSRHFSDPSERPNAIWISERRYRCEKLLESIFFSECTPRYPVQVRVTVSESGPWGLVFSCESWPVSQERWIINQVKPFPLCCQHRWCTCKFQCCFGYGLVCFLVL